jgi:hypothetical protein
MAISNGVRMKFPIRNDVPMNLTVAGLTLFHEFAVIFATILLFGIGCENERFRAFIAARGG